MRPSVSRPNFRRAYQTTQVGIRDQLRKERANLSDRIVRLHHRWLRVAMMTEDQIAEYARLQAERRAIRAIVNWNADRYGSI